MIRSWTHLRRLLALATLVVGPAAVAQSADSTCRAVVAANADTLARLQLPGAELYPTQRRSRDRLLEVAAARCVTPTPDTVRVVVTDTVIAVVSDTVVVVRVDTVYVPQDSAPPAPPASPYVLLPVLSDSVRPVGQVVVITVRVDSAGVAVGDSAGITLGGASAVVTWGAGARRWRVTGTAPGTVIAELQYGGASRTVSFVVTDTGGAPPPPPPPSAPSGGAELPRSVPVVPAALATASCTQSVTAAALPGAVAQATSGDVLCLAPGAVHRGTLTLGARNDAGWVVIRTAPALGQPAPGERVLPSQRASLATIEAVGTNPAIVTAPGARGWLLTVLEVTTDASLSSWTNALVDLATPPTLATMAQDIAFDRVWAHGWPHRPLRRCFALQSGATTIVNSWVDDCHEKGSDSQAIISWSGTGPYLIENNYLAGAGENLMFGGAQPAFRTVPCDITLRRNHIETPLAWSVRTGGQTPWTKKNLIESKSSCRVLVEHNVIEGSWPDGQDGTAFVLKTTASSSANVTAPFCPWCLTSDWTIRQNLILRAVRPFAINGNSGSGQGNSDKADSLTRRIVIEDNYADSINVGAPYAANKSGFVQVFNNPAGVVVRRNVFLGTALSHSWEMSTSKCPSVTDLTITDNLWSSSRYNIWGGTVAAPFVQCIAGGASLARNLLIGAAAPVPAGFGFVPSLAAGLAAGFGVSRATIDAATRGVVVQP